MRVIVAAAGTAGHINPGLAIANKIKEEEPDSEIIFIGTKRGLENDLVPRAGYELKTIEAYGLSKKISIENFKKMYATLMATGKARKIIKEFKPDIIVGAGGYICGPVVWAANKEKIPVVLHESNAFPGKAVKMLAPKVNTVLISFEEARSRIPNAKNIVFTGTPVKIEKKEYTKEQKDKRDTEDKRNTKDERDTEGKRDTEEEATRRKGCTMILHITLQPFQHPVIRIPSLHQSRDIAWSTPWVPLLRFRSGRDLDPDVRRSGTGNPGTHFP